MPIPNPGGNVYKRDTPEDLHEAWNAAIRKVNDERANPPEGTNCEALDLIEEVEEDHVWIKTNVENLRSAIDEMCAYTWTEDLTYWKDAILTEIEEALNREWGGWGDEGECCKEECLPDCDNAQGTVEFYIGSYVVTECLASPGPVTWPFCDFDYIQAAMDAGHRASAATYHWSVYWGEYCVLVEEVEELEEELEQLEEELAVLEAVRDAECAKPPPNRCAQRQAEVDAKQAEVDAKQAELDAKEAERDTKKEEADAAESEAEAEAASSMAFADDAAPVGCQLYYTSLPGNELWTNTACDELGPECLGKDPARCQVQWSVYKKSHYYYYWGGEWHSNWTGEAGGGYTMAGSPYIAAFRSCSGIPGYACARWAVTCEYGCPNYMEEEVKLTLRYPKPNPGGEECCD